MTRIGVILKPYYRLFNHVVEEQLENVPGISKLKRTPSDTKYDYTFQTNSGLSSILERVSHIVGAEFIEMENNDEEIQK